MGKPKDTMLYHVIHTPAFHSLYGRGSVPDTSFGADGFNDAIYTWAPTNNRWLNGGNGGTTSSYNWKPACKGAIQAWKASAGLVGNWNTSCRAFDPYYNELFDVDTSERNWNNGVVTDPGSVDGWLNNVGGGIY